MASSQMALFNPRTSLFLILYALFFLTVPCSSVSGYQFKVGDGCGWTLNPNQTYSHWAERNRFQVNDTLYFKYDKNIDSVLIVDKDQFDKCDATKPLLKLEGGESVFKFDRSGSFFFITSNVTSCQNGQKLIVVVLGVRPPPPPPPHVQPPLASPPSPTPLPPVPVPSASALLPGPLPTVEPSTEKGAGAAVFGPATVVFSAVCALVGLSVISV